MATSVIDNQRVYRFKQNRWNPVRGLSPEILIRQIDDFQSGYLRNFALTMDALERRDDVIQCVAPKRKAAISRRTYEIITDPEADPKEAEAHKEALSFFYKNLEVTDAVDMNKRRGFSLLVEQMMDALGKKYAVHEILWKPQKDSKGDWKITARMNFVPLCFFENITGSLRFLETDFATYGRDLEAGGWMVSVGAGIMEACAVAYMYKHIPLKDWLIYCERHGTPGIQGKTPHKKGSAQWNNLADAVSKIATDYSVVISKDEEIDKIDFSATGQLPFGPLVERMDRALSALWRGADLSTISAGSGTGQGASLQGEEAHALEMSDAQFIGETLNANIDPLVIAWKFGAGVKPAAYIKITVPPKIDTTKEIQIDEFLRDSGVPLAKGATAERYGRAQADTGEDVLEKSQAAPKIGDGLARPIFANERTEAKRLVDASARKFSEESVAALAPLRARIENVLEMPNEVTLKIALRRLRHDLPGLIVQIGQQPNGAKALEEAIVAGWFNGLTEGSK